VKRSSLLSLTMSCVAFLPLLDRPIDLLKRQHPELNHVSFEFSGTGRIDDTEVNMIGTLGPQEFFESLVRTEGVDGDTIRFMRGSSEVKVFPDSLTIRLVVVLGAITRNRKFSTAKVDDPFMKSLKFQAQWKEGLQMRSVREITLKEVSPIRSPNLPALKAWGYNLLVKDTDVPLMDHLIVTVASPDGKNIARLSAHL
jgi:hypothetical protein